MFALAAAAATLGLASTAAAGPFRRSPTLSIDVSAPESVKSLNDLSVVATVTNTGSEAVKVLFPSLREPMGGGNTPVYYQREGAELEYEIEMTERLTRVSLITLRWMMFD